MADCTKCASSPSCERVWKGMNNPMCVGFKPIWTNFAMIKAMSEEELADFIARYMDCEVCPAEKPEETCGTLLNCRKLLIDWLREPAEDTTP